MNIEKVTAKESLQFANQLWGIKHTKQHGSHQSHIFAVEGILRKYFVLRFKVAEYLEKKWPVLLNISKKCILCGYF